MFLDARRWKIDGPNCWDWLATDRPPRRWPLAAGVPRPIIAPAAVAVDPVPLPRGRPGPALTAGRSGAPRGRSSRRAAVAVDPVPLADHRKPRGICPRAGRFSRAIG